MDRTVSTSIRRSLWVAMSCGLLFAGCAAAALEPKAQEGLARARAAYEQAKMDPSVNTFAPVALVDAEKAFQAASQATDSQDVEHLSYLAERKSQIALALGEGRKAEKDTEQLTAETASIMLKVREREVAAARADAAAKARELEGVRHEVQARSQELAQTRQQLGTTSQNLEQARRELDARSQALEQARQELGTRGQDLDQARRELDARSQALEQARQELGTKGQDLDQARRELEARSQALDQARQEVGTKGQDLDQVRRELEARDQTLEQARQELTMRGQELERTRWQLDAKAAELEQTRQDIEVKSQEVDQMRAQAEASAREAEQIAREFSEFKAKQTDRGVVLTLGDLLFAYDRAAVSPGMTRAIDQLARFLEKNPDRTAVIEGHTDNIGSEQYNLALATKRAEAVKALLVAQGISPERIVTRGYGEQYPVSPNDSASGRQRNRRVEVVIANGTMMPSASPATR
jgi:outer membrane protein OmpA-like peptidoglycan-associated protein